MAPASPTVARVVSRPGGSLLQGSPTNPAACQAASNQRLPRVRNWAGSGRLLWRSCRIGIEQWPRSNPPVNDSRLPASSEDSRSIRWSNRRGLIAITSKRSRLVTLQAIPSEFYAVSFLRQYAGVLGLPSDKMVGALRQQLADLEEIPEQRLFNEVSLSPHALRAAAIEKIRRWTGEFFANRSNAVVAGILMLAGALGWWYVGSLDTVAVAAPSPGADVESQRAPEVGAGAAERTGTGASNSVRPTTTSIAPASEPARLGSAETLAIQLQASGEVWVRAVVDGGRSQESIMQAGNRRAFRARERLQFTAGNAGAITLVVKWAGAGFHRRARAGQAR